MQIKLQVILLVNFEGMSNFKTQCCWPAWTSSPPYLHITKIQITQNRFEKRFTPSFIIFNDLSNKTKFTLGVRCTLRNSSHPSPSSRHTEDIKCLEWRCLQDDVENTLATTKYPFSLFCTKNSFVLEVASSSLLHHRS